MQRFVARSRWIRWRRAVVCTAALVMAAGAPGAAVALPDRGPDPVVDRGSVAAKGSVRDRQFTSSFEAGERAPDWRSTVESTPGGGKRAAGVDGGYGGGLPGDVTDRVTDVRASAENTAGGEVKENLVDGEAGTKWLAF
ncbi:hypothetical protein RKD18_006145 [Streptomyces phaeoluteigriseus]